MKLEDAIREAELAARTVKIEMCVVHAPLENAEEEEPYGYCPKLAVPTLYAHAIKGIGQENCPAQGIVKTIKP